VKARAGVPFLLLVLAILGVARTQPRLAAIAHTVKERDDVYAFPPPAVLHAATLGWDAAVVDQLWARLLGEYGLHWSEKREFNDTPKYVDAILELEPTFAPIYKLVTTLLAYRPLQGTEHDVRLARAYLERGMQTRADDYRVWREYGQFLIYIAPSFLHDSKEIEDWRRAGAEALGHAVELGADADQALPAATYLSRGGATSATIHFLERAYALTEDPSMSEVHETIRRRLVALEARAMFEAADATAKVIDARWHQEMPFIGRDRYLLLGPVTNPARCAGITATGDVQCARDWAAIASAAGVTNISAPESSADSP
jgi:hypothetical protein